jgi:hypothetical protein
LKPAADLEDEAERAVWEPDIAGDADPAPIDPALDHELMVPAVTSTLPGEFANSHCWWQLTSSAGLKPGCRTRLWFWLDRPVSDAEAQRWLGGSPVDCSIYSSVQPHYVAWPIFRPRALDPVPIRSGMWWRHAAEVPVPDLPEPPPPPPPEPPAPRIVAPLAGDHRVIARACLERGDLTDWEAKFCTRLARLSTITDKQSATLVRIADPLPARAQAYAAAVLANLARTSQGEWHNAMRSAAITLYQLVEADLLDGGDVTRDLLAIAAQLRRPQHRVLSMLDWCRALAAASPDLPEAFR